MMVSVLKTGGNGLFNKFLLNHYDCELGKMIIKVKSKLKQRWATSSTLEGHMIQAMPTKVGPISA